MSYRYGQSITWGTPTAPHLFTGVCLSYSEREQLQRQLIADEGPDNVAVVLHSKKTEIDFEARVTAGSTNFLNLATGAAIAVDGIESGVVLAREATERWTLMQPKTCRVAATHYPDMVQADPDSAGTDLSAVTPDQAALGIVFPGLTLIYSTFGLTHASGVVHALTLRQQLTITEDEPSPDGKLLGAGAHAYLRTIELDLLATGAKPATGTVLAVTGAPAHAGGYRIEASEKKFQTAKGVMYSIGAIWIPPFAA